MEVNDDERIAGIFNKYFVEKVEKIRANLDNQLMEDPTSRLTEKMKNVKHALLIKPAKEADVLKAIKNL